MRSASHRKPLIRNVCVEILIDAFQMQGRGSPHGESRNPAGLASMNFRGKFRPGAETKRKPDNPNSVDFAGIDLTDRRFYGQPSDLSIGEYFDARSGGTRFEATRYLLTMAAPERLAVEEIVVFLRSTPLLGRGSEGEPHRGEPAAT